SNACAEPAPTVTMKNAVSPSTPNRGSNPDVNPLPAVAPEASAQEPATHSKAAPAACKATARAKHRARDTPAARTAMSPAAEASKTNVNATRSRLYWSERSARLDRKQ